MPLRRHSTSTTPFTWGKVKGDCEAQEDVMLRTFTLGLVAMALSGASFVGGWLARGSPPIRAPSEVEREVVVRAEPVSDARLPVGEDNCRAELEELRAELEELRTELRGARAGDDQCDTEREQAPAGGVSDEEFAVFRDTILEAAETIGYEGEVNFDCREFPCIAMFEADFDPSILERALRDLHGANVDILTQRHTSVGPGGSKKMRFAAVVPHERRSKSVETRFEERTWQFLIQEHVAARHAAE